VYSVLGAVGCFFLFRFEDEKIAIGGFVLLAALAWRLFKYFKSDFGNQYKIPLVKISAIDKYEKGLKINFLNAANEPDFEIVNNVDAVGIGILTQLKIIKYDLGIS
jgi:hypothetical protein